MLWSKGVKWALDAFWYYLLVWEFLLEMDHQPLQWMDCMQDTNAGITCWLKAFKTLNYSVLVSYLNLYL